MTIGDSSVVGYTLQSLRIGGLTAMGMLSPWRLASTVKWSKSLMGSIQDSKEPSWVPMRTPLSPATVNGVGRLGENEI